MQTSLTLPVIRKAVEINATAIAQPELLYLLLCSSLSFFSRFFFMLINRTIALLSARQGSAMPRETII